MWTPCLVSSTTASGEVAVRVGHELVDDHLHFLSGRSRPNSVLAAGYDLKVFFAWSTKEPAEVRSKDVINFVAAQRSSRPGSKVVRLSDGGAGRSSPGARAATSGSSRCRRASSPAPPPTSTGSARRR